MIEYFLKKILNKQKNDEIKRVHKASQSSARVIYPNREFIYKREHHYKTDYRKI